MKNAKTLFVAVFCATLSFGSFSQSHSPLVDDDGDLIGTIDGDDNILYIVKDESDKPIIVTLDDGTETFVYLDPSVKMVQSDIPLVDDNGDQIIVTRDDGMQEFVFPPATIDPSQLDVPLVDENGKTIIITREDGTKTFLYPPQEKK